MILDNVKTLVERFCREQNVSFEVKNGFWIVRKP